VYTCAGARARQPELRLSPCRAAARTAAAPVRPMQRRARAPADGPPAAPQTQGMGIRGGYGPSAAGKPHRRAHGARRAGKGAAGRPRGGCRPSAAGKPHRRAHGARRAGTESRGQAARGPAPTRAHACSPPRPRACSPGAARTSTSGNVSFSRRMARCTRPSGLNASSAVGVFRCSGVGGGHGRGRPAARPRGNRGRARR